MVSLKMAFASRGTPGRQKITVAAVFVLTAGAVPTGLKTALPEAGNMAIFNRALVNFTVDSGNLLE
jgi:hypothetical protein